MRIFLLLAFLSFSFFVHVATADPDGTYWAGVNQYQLNVNDSFHLDDYNITLNHANEISPGQFEVYLEIVNATTEDYEIMDAGQTLFLSGNRTQFTYIRMDYAKRQVFAAWKMRAPSLTLTSELTPVVNTSNINTNLTLKNNGDVVAENVVVTLIPPTGATISSTNIPFQNVSVASSGTATKSTNIFCTPALINRTIVARVTYMYGRGTQAGSFVKLLSMPINNSTVTTTISNTDIASFSTPLPSVIPASNTTTAVTPIPLTTTSASVPVNKTPSHKPRVVTFRLHPAPVETPTPVDVSVSQQQDNSAPQQQDNSAPLTVPQMDFTLTKNDKGILLVCTLLFGWFIIYKL
jgi:hypothetical protein